MNSRQSRTKSKGRTAQPNIPLSQYLSNQDYQFYLDNQGNQFYLDNQGNQFYLDNQGNRGNQGYPGKQNTFFNDPRSRDLSQARDPSQARSRRDSFVSTTSTFNTEFSRNRSQSRHSGRNRKPITPLHKNPPNEFIDNGILVLWLSNYSNYMMNHNLSIENNKVNEVDDNTPFQPTVEKFDQNYKLLTNNLTVVFNHWVGNFKNQQNTDEVKNFIGIVKREIDNADKVKKIQAGNLNIIKLIAFTYIQNLSDFIYKITQFPSLQKELKNVLNLMNILADYLDPKVCLETAKLINCLALKLTEPNKMKLYSKKSTDDNGVEIKVKEDLEVSLDFLNITIDQTKYQSIMKSEEKVFTIKWKDDKILDYFYDLFENKRNNPSMIQIEKENEALSNLILGYQIDINVKPLQLWDVFMKGNFLKDNPIVTEIMALHHILIDEYHLSPLRLANIDPSLLISMKDRRNDEYYSNKEKVFEVSKYDYTRTKEWKNKEKKKFPREQLIMQTSIRGAANNLNDLILSLMTLASPYLLGQLIFRFAGFTQSQIDKRDPQNPSKNITASEIISRLIPKYLTAYTTKLMESLDMFHRTTINKKLITLIDYTKSIKDESQINELLEKMEKIKSEILNYINNYKNIIPKSSKHMKQGFIIDELYNLSGNANNAGVSEDEDDDEEYD